MVASSLTPDVSGVLDPLAVATSGVVGRTSDAYRTVMDDNTMRMCQMLGVSTEIQNGIERMQIAGGVQMD